MSAECQLSFFQGLAGSPAACERRARTAPGSAMIQDRRQRPAKACRRERKQIKLIKTPGAATNADDRDELGDDRAVLVEHGHRVEVAGRG